MNTESARPKLEALKSVISERLVRTHKHLYEREKRVSAKFAEQSVEMENQELVLNLDAGGRDELRQIERALRRIEQGEYGTCDRCSHEIPEARLVAIPYVTYCVDCAD